MKTTFQHYFQSFVFILFLGLTMVFSQEESVFAKKVKADFIKSLQTENMGAHEQAWVGKKAPHVKVQDMSGEWVQFEDYRGKLIVLNFWNNKCPPCISEFPTLNKIVAHYINDPRIVFWAFGANKPQEIQAILDRHPFDYRQLSDPTASAGLLFENRGNPVQLLIDPQGKVAFRYLGVLPEFALRAKIDEQLALMPSLQP